MTDIIIPLGNGSAHNDLELLFCLRSIEKHIKNYRDIYIIGSCPEWLQNIIHIPFVDSVENRQKERNICSKIMNACDNENVSDNFLFFNDDHFILQDFEANNFPLHYKGSLHEAQSKATRGNAYRVSIDNTLRHLQHHHKTLYNFDTHCPILYNKADFKAVMENCNWGRPYGFLIKSLYCNSLGFTGEYYMDCKIKDSRDTGSIKDCIANRHYFSVDDAGFNSNMQQILLQLFPNPSKYENKKSEIFEILR